MSQRSSAQMAALMMGSLDDLLAHPHRLQHPAPITTTMATTPYACDQHLFGDHIQYSSASLLPCVDAKFTPTSASRCISWTEALARHDASTMNASDSSGTSSDSNISLLSDGPFAQFSSMNGSSTWASPDLSIDATRKASRFVLVRNISSHADEKSLSDALNSMGDLKAVFADRLRTQRELVAVYYDIRDAHRLLFKTSLAVHKQDPFYGTWVTFCTCDDLAKLHGAQIKSCAEFMVRVKGSDFTPVPDILATCGDLQSLRQNDMILQQCVFVGEYFDERSVVKAINELHNKVIQNLHFEFTDVRNPYKLPSSSYSTVFDNMREESESSASQSNMGHLLDSALVTQMNEYGDNQYQSINTLLQQLRGFKSPMEVSLEDIELTHYVSQNNFTTGKALRSSPTASNEIDIDRILMGLDKRTTCMIRNIPNKYTQQMLIDCINTTHNAEYDFLYLRIDFKNKCNVGYAFINFIELRSLVTFAQQRVGRKWNRFNSEKRCTLSYANIQGRKALVEKFRNSSVMDEEESYQPKIFVSAGEHRGEEEPFPPPTLPSDVRKRKQQRHNLTASTSHRPSTFLDYYRHADGSHSGDD